MLCSCRLPYPPADGVLLCDKAQLWPDRLPLRAPGVPGGELMDSGSQGNTARLRSAIMPPGLLISWQAVRRPLVACRKTLLSLLQMPLTVRPLSLLATDTPILLHALRSGSSSPHRRLPSSFRGSRQQSGLTPWRRCPAQSCP